MNDELKHYGVMGMKWGMHRARKNNTTYTYRSHSTKKYERKAAKASRKGDKVLAKKYSNRAKRSAEHDAKMQKMAANTKVSHLVVQSALFTPFITSYYHKQTKSLQASGVSKGKSYALAWLGFGTPIGNAAMIAKRRYITQDERKSKKK